ncbi:helix-turn-helix domain-containing protein [Bosea sp. (in: a-proteobacteria)]|uniref:helix-turn-helix domain-containing protein n=1 Tax=Bosea sp. (in: a-proteobacteria) TaxID=1871050 RepID=UPI00262A15B6|nr:helix-turn-helix domain-containing protein [Bosea sp. (in: a-proteobacteria)]MCO5092651.1 helix-turn-helix domain-containing protein [Bosea sp. (in: a-proteobacteria)]
MAERGRPTDYRPEFAEQASKLCALGATDYELADFFGVDTRTIYRWKNVHADFCQAVTCGKESADERVERALFNRAVGYTFESEKVFQHQGEIIRAPVDEHVPPDPSAAKLWLTNRRPDRWRDKVVNEHTGADGGAIETVTRIERVIVRPNAIDPNG